MHKMSRKKVTVGNDGVSMLMWCDGCKDFVRFYSSGGRVRCASALRNYQNKGKSMDAEEDMIDVSVVNTTNDMVELWSDEQKGHCRLCDEYQRKARNGPNQLFMVAFHRDGYVRGLFCWSCRTYLMNKMNGDLDTKADWLLAEPLVSRDDG
jgi:hypothetical protein